MASGYSLGENIRKTDFRNCMMHFELKDKGGNSLISETALNSLYSAINTYLGFELLLKV